MIERLGGSPTGILPGKARPIIGTSPASRSITRSGMPWRGRYRSSPAMVDPAPALFDDNLARAVSEILERAALSRQLDDQPFTDRDAPVHLSGQIHVVGGDDGRELRAVHELLERVEDVR